MGERAFLGEAAAGEKRDERSHRDVVVTFAPFAGVFSEGRAGDPFLLATHPVPTCGTAPSRLLYGQPGVSRIRQDRLLLAGAWHSAVAVADKLGKSLQLTQSVCSCSQTSIYNYLPHVLDSHPNQERRC